MNGPGLRTSLIMDHRAKVGPAEYFDLIGAQQFCVLVNLGLRAHHRLLDVGCGCLRGGRFLIPYLAWGNYYGLEPDRQLLNEGIRSELGGFWLPRRAPEFHQFADFRLSRISESFDYILAQSILSHAGWDIAWTIFKEAGKALADQGIFAATWFQGEEEANLNGWHGRSIVRYQDSTMADMALASGFQSLQVLDVKHPMGQTWFAARKGA